MDNKNYRALFTDIPKVKTSRLTLRKMCVDDVNDMYSYASLEEVCKYGMNDDCGLLVNASRAIIFADSSENFAAVAAEKAADYQQQMENELKLRNII